MDLLFPSRINVKQFLNKISKNVLSYQLDKPTKQVYSILHNEQDILSFLVTVLTSIEVSLYQSVSIEALAWSFKTEEATPMKK